MLKLNYYIKGNKHKGDTQTQGHNMSNKYQPHELPKRIVKGKVKFFNLGTLQY